MGLLLAHSTWGMPTMPIDVAVAHCAGLGFDGLELTVIPGRTTDAATLDAAERRRIRRLYDDHRIALCALSGNTPVLAQDASEVAVNQARFRSYLDLAAELQRPGERLTVSTTSGGAEEDWEATKDLLVERFGALAAFAERAGVAIGVETHVGQALCLPEQVLWIIDQVKSPALTVLFDISHFNIRGIDMDEVIALLAPHSLHTHVKDERGVAPDHEFLIPGEGEMDYVRYLRAMARTSYSGYITTEISVMVQRRPDYDPLAAATQSYQVLARAFEGARILRQRAESPPWHGYAQSPQGDGPEGTPAKPSAGISIQRQSTPALQTTAATQEGTLYMNQPTPRRLALLDAPSNLGLRPPAPGCVPGCAKLAGALRDQGLLTRLGADDAGVVTPPRYIPDWEPGPRVRNSGGLAWYTPRLAARIGRLLDAGRFPIVLGGDCSVLLGAALALRQHGRYGLAFLDGHSDFRHLGNAPAVGAAAGEDLALVTGRGQADIAAIDDLRPYIAESDVAVVGIRDDDGALAELAGLTIPTWTATQCRGQAAGEAARAALRHIARPELDGYWLHLDADILDSTIMPAVDSPGPGGLDWADLAALLAPLVGHPAIIGLDLTIYDPDLDPDGYLAAPLADLLIAALAGKTMT